MNKSIIDYAFNNAADDDYLKIDYGTNSITVKKEFSRYSFKGKGYYLKLKDLSRKETYLIKTDSMDMITIIKPKFGSKAL